MRLEIIGKGLLHSAALIGQTQAFWLLQHVSSCSLFRQRTVVPHGNISACHVRFPPIYFNEVRLSYLLPCEMNRSGIRMSLIHMHTQSLSLPAIFQQCRMVERERTDMSLYEAFTKGFLWYNWKKWAEAVKTWNEHGDINTPVESIWSVDITFFLPQTEFVLPCRRLLISCEMETKVCLSLLLYGLRYELQQSSGGVAPNFTSSRGKTKWCYCDWRKVKLSPICGNRIYNHRGIFTSDHPTWEAALCAKPLWRELSGY